MRKLVVLSGAGISAESGLKTFRDDGGLWNGYRVEEVATPEAWAKHPEKVLEFYNERRRGLLAACPNKAHLELVRLAAHYDVHIITQNVDDLHERAGSSKVLHLHGELLSMCSSADPDLVYDIRDDIRLGQLAADGSQLRPNIVWFGESVPRIEEAKRIVSEADIFVIIGTSLQVYPAAGLMYEIRDPDVPVFIIDKEIPMGVRKVGIEVIEMPATLGVSALVRRLL